MDEIVSFYYCARPPLVGEFHGTVNHVLVRP